jgi:hypothetical protein
LIKQSPAEFGMVLKQTIFTNRLSTKPKVIIMYLKNKKLRLQYFCFLTLCMLFVSPALFSQQQPDQDSPQTSGYSDRELENFVEAVLEVLPLQEEIQLKMIMEIEGRNLSIERFSTILETQQNGEEPDVTDEEIEAFENALIAIQDIQIEYHDSIISAIENAGMSPGKYGEIMTQYEQDPDLQMRVNSIIEEMN